MVQISNLQKHPKFKKCLLFFKFKKLKKSIRKTIRNFRFEQNITSLLRFNVNKILILFWAEKGGKFNSFLVFLQLFQVYSLILLLTSRLCAKFISTHLVKFCVIQATRQGLNKKKFQRYFLRN